MGADMINQPKMKMILLLFSLMAVGIKEQCKQAASGLKQPEDCFVVECSASNFTPFPGSFWCVQLHLSLMGSLVLEIKTLLWLA